MFAVNFKIRCTLHHKWRAQKSSKFQIYFFFAGSQLYGAKRGRPQYSSLIPFPRCCLFCCYHSNLPSQVTPLIVQPNLIQATNPPRFPSHPIPPARVGRSGGVREYYGQKRGGKSGLIPFPRCPSLSLMNSLPNPTNLIQQL